MKHFISVIMLIPALGAFSDTETKSPESSMSLSSISALLASGSEPVRIVCFGDSVTGLYYHSGGRRAYADMLRIALRSVFPGASLSVINAGISGNTTVDALARIDADVIEHRPQLVTVMFGLNDMTRVPLPEYEANLGKIIVRCRDAGAEVLLCTPNAVIDTPDRPTEKLEIYVAAVKSVGERWQASVVDCYAAYQEIRARDPLDFALLMSDEIHPNMDGHELVAERIAERIAGQPVSLANEGPPVPAIPHTLALLGESEPIRIHAMPPYDRLFPEALNVVNPDAQVSVTVWPVEGKTVPEIEEESKQVRGMGVDLVVIAVPLEAQAESLDKYIRSSFWIMNHSLSFGHQEWDVVAFPPSAAAAGLSGESLDRDQLARRIIRAQDLGTLARAPGDVTPLAELLVTWLRKQ